MRLTDAADSYQQAKWCAATAFTEAKTRDREEFGEAMENLFWTTAERFWTTIQRLRVGMQCTINTVYSGDDALLNSPKNVVDRWREYFEDLNPTDRSSAEEAGPGYSGIGSFISGAKVTEVVPWGLVHE